MRGKRTKAQEEVHRYIKNRVKEAKNADETMMVFRYAHGYKFDDLQLMIVEKTLGFAKKVGTCMWVRHWAPKNSPLKDEALEKAYAMTKSNAELSSYHEDSLTYDYALLAANAPKGSDIQIFGLEGYYNLAKDAGKLIDVARLAPKGSVIEREALEKAYNLAKDPWEFKGIHQNAAEGSELKQMAFLSIINPAVKPAHKAI